MRVVRLLAAALGASVALLGAIVWLLGGVTAPTSTLPERHSSAETEAALRELMGMRNSDVLPDVRFERFPGIEEVEAVMLGCYQELGVNVNVDSRGNASWSTSSEAENAEIFVAIRSCTLRFPPPVYREMVMSDEERVALADYARNVVTPCLRSNGLSVPRLLSSKELFTWNPYAFVVGDRLGPGSDDLRMQMLRGRCPWVPPGWDQR